MPEDQPESAAWGLLADVLGYFTERGHPGEPCLRTGWVKEATVANWRRRLAALHVEPMTSTGRQLSDMPGAAVRGERELRSPIVFLDTETTGLDRLRRRIWEVAAVRREPDGTETTYAAMVRDIDLAEADPAGLRVGRFFERHPRFGGTLPPTVEEDMEVFIAQRLEELTRGAHLVGAVPSFDEETLANLLREHGLCPSWHYHLIDVENLAAGLLGWQPPYDSDELSAALGVEPTDERHTALGDALWTRDLYDAVIDRAERQDGRR